MCKFNAVALLPGRPLKFVNNLGEESSGYLFICKTLETVLCVGPKPAIPWVGTPDYNYWTPIDV